MSVDEASRDDLFVSSAEMAGAINYADWTYSLFAPLVRGAVLEVGCGIGIFTRRLIAAPALDSLLSIDISPAAVRKCRSDMTSPAVEVRLADVRDVAGSFDLVVCMNVLEHIEDDRAALEHMLRLLKPGGTLFLLVPSHHILYSSFDVAAGHFRRYNKRGMLELLGQAWPGERPQVRQFYFNTVGALGYFAVYRLLRKAPRDSAGTEIGSFDRYVVPWLRRIERFGSPFGLSLVTVVSNSEQPK